MARRRLQDPEFIESARRQVEANQSERLARERQGYFLPHIECEFQGHRIRAVGGRIYARPLAETFDEFLIYTVTWALGERWFREQRALPEARRHFIMQCWDHYHSWKARNTGPASTVGEPVGAVPDGWTRSLFALGVDIYSLLHRGSLPRRLVGRLLHPDQYQGARYEIAMAGMFVRVGCSIELLDRGGSAQRGRHAEFIATHTGTGVRIAVEAKSRHRPGVLGRSGVAQSPDEVRGDVEGLIRDAIGQRHDGIPFLIFVDVNAPMDVNTPAGRRPWVDDVEAFVRELDAGTLERPVPWNALVLTNYAFHYATENEAAGGQYIARAADHALMPLPSSDLLTHIRTGLENYGSIPPLA